MKAQSLVINWRYRFWTRNPGQHCGNRFSSDGGAQNVLHRSLSKSINTKTNLSVVRYKSTKVTEPQPDPGDVIRRVSLYIEEDERLATLLAKSVSSESIRSLHIALDSIRYTVLEPSVMALRLVAFRNAVPFVAFGIMDNAIMIIAGEYIDLTLGVAFGISTMAAAALGNLVSDIAGIGLGSIVERWASKMGLPDPGLSRSQMKLSSVKIAGNIGCAVGVTVGCLIGMFPLLLLPSTDTLEEKKRMEKMVALVDVVIHEAVQFLNCEEVTLFIKERHRQILQSNTRSYGCIKALDLSCLEEPIKKVLKEGTPVNVPASELKKSSLYMPVLDANRNTRAVMKAVGKKGQLKYAGFTASDEDALRALCSHISADLDILDRLGDAEADLQDTLKLLKTHGNLSTINFPPSRIVP